MSALQNRCQTLAASILKEMTIFDTKRLEEKDDAKQEEEEDVRAHVLRACKVVEHESTKIGVLFSKQGEELKEEVSNSALDSFHVSLIAFTAYVNAALMNENYDIDCHRKQVKSLGEAVLRASASLIEAVGKRKENVRNLTASVWEQCKSAEKTMPRDGKDAVGKALMTHCRFIKDAKREIEEMLLTEGEEEFKKEDGEKVEDDFGEEIVREEIKEVDREVLGKAKVTIECTFAFLKALVVPLISNSDANNNFSKSRKERATALNEIEKKCKEIRSAVDEIICEAMPPSDADALASEAKKLKDAAEDMMKRVEEVLTGRDDTKDDDEMNHVDAAKKALAGVQSACAKM